MVHCAQKEMDMRLDGQATQQSPSVTQQNHAVCSKNGLWYTQHDIVWGRDDNPD